MDATHFAALLRTLATTPSRRGVARGLTGFTLAGALSPFLGFTEADAKRHKKRKRRRKKKQRKKQEPPQPFCAGRNYCVDDTAVCDDGSPGSSRCPCLPTVESGEPFCTHEWTVTTACSACSEEEPCILDCSGQLGCARPCPNPL